jgi:RNA polymerase sigma-70 factor, ECF subfamily
MSSHRDNAAGALRLVPRDPNTPLPTERPALADEALIAAVRAGDPAIASELCDRVWTQVDRTVRRLLGHGDSDRDDLSQLALIELVSTIGRYRGDCSLDSWAQTVTSHVVFKHIRRRQVERRIFGDLLADEADVAPAVATPLHAERLSTTRQSLERVALHLDEMNPGRAWAFVMHDILGYDLREVAQMTKTSVAATQSRLVRGRRELHARIAGDPDLVDLMARTEGNAKGGDGG